MEKEKLKRLEEIKWKKRSLEEEEKQIIQELEDKYKFKECSNCGLRFKADENHNEEICNYVNR